MSIKNYDALTILNRIENAFNIGHWQIDLKTDEIFWSDEIYNIHGVSRESFTPTLLNAIDFYHPEDRDRVIYDVSNAIEKAVNFTFELRLIRPDGEIRYVKSTGECHVDISGDTNSVFGLFMDITKYKSNEKKLKDSNNFMNLVLEAIPEYIFVKDENSKIKQANAKFLNLYPEDKQDKIIGYTTFDDYKDEDVQAFLAEDKKALKDGNTEIVENLLFPDGERRTFHTQKVRFEDADHTPYIVGIARDISETKTMEKRLRKSNKQLEEFAYIASHDLKAPMRQIKMCAEHLNTALTSKLDEDAKAYLDIMIDASSKMQTMLDHLLSYSTMNSQNKNNELINIRECIEAALDNLSTVIKEKSPQIKVNVPAEISTYGEPVLLAQLFQNLIDNAIKYTAVDTTPIIDVDYIEKNGFHEFSITDQGIGISDKFADKIFLMFKRLHGESSDYEGSGIGLAFCKQIIQSHSGQIWLNTNYTQGTQFIFTLPILQT